MAEQSCTKGQYCHNHFASTKSLPLLQNGTNFMHSSTAQPVRMDAASASLNIRQHLADGSPYLSQQVGPWLHDHRGRSTLASVGVLTDLCLALGARDSAVAAVLASISVSMAAPLPTSGHVMGVCDNITTDFQAGTALIGSRLLDERGETLAYVRGRSAVVERPRVDALDAVRDAIDLRQHAWTSDHCSLGPWADRVGVVITTRDASGTTGTWTVLPWTTNAMGGVHGGMLLGLCATITELAAEPLAAHGAEPRLADIHVDYLRSPTLAAPDLKFAATITRAGRRFANLDVALRDRADRLMVQSRATITFH
jgi:uncharacterized protein (TIGR00369 family)